MLLELFQRVGRIAAYENKNNANSMFELAHEIKITSHHNAVYMVLFVQIFVSGLHQPCTCYFPVMTESIIDNLYITEFCK